MFISYNKKVTLEMYLSGKIRSYNKKVTLETYVYTRKKVLLKWKADNKNHYTKNILKINTNYNITYIGCETMANDIKTTVDELQKLININNVIGQPIETEDKVLIPVMRMGVGFGVGENITGQEGSCAVGAGAGLEPVTMVMIPKTGNDAEGVRVLNLSKGSEANKALGDLSLIVSDLVKSYLGKEEDHDESEYIEPEFTTKVDIEDDE